MMQQKSTSQQPCAALCHGPRLQIRVTKRSQCFEQTPKEPCFGIVDGTLRKISRRSESFFSFGLTERFGLHFGLDLCFPGCGNMFQ